jgi:hypothetical protein
MRRRPDTRDKEWERIGNQGKEVYRQAWRLREDAKERKGEAADYFNPYDCLKKREVGANRSASEPRNRLISKSRSFDRLYSPLSPLIKALQPVHSFRHSLKVLLTPIARPQSLSVLQQKGTPARTITTEDIGNYRENLVPLLKKLAPGSFSVKRRKRPAPEEIRQVRSLKPVTNSISPVRARVRELKWVDRSLQKPPQGLEKRPEVLKEWEISLSTYLTRLKRKQESRRK